MRRATNVILAPSAGCQGFAHRSVTSVPARKLSEFQDLAYSYGSFARYSCVGYRNVAYSYGSFGPRELKKISSVREIRRMFGAGDVADGAYSSRKRHPGRETQTPVPAKLGPVDLLVETQACADPTLPTASRSGKLSKLAWSIT